MLELSLDGPIDPPLTCTASAGDDAPAMPPRAGASCVCVGAGVKKVEADMSGRADQRRHGGSGESRAASRSRGRRSARTTESQVAAQRNPMGG